jgi:hypothetical protein
MIRNGELALRIHLSAKAFEHLAGGRRIFGRSRLDDRLKIFPAVLSRRGWAVDASRPRHQRTCEPPHRTVQNHHPPIEDRSGRPGRDDRHRPRRDDLPREVRQGVAAGRRYYRGPTIPPVAKGGRLGTERLTDQSVCKVVKAYAKRIGLKAGDFGAHSLRAGFLTSAARRGASVFKMRDVSRHKSMDVLQAYVRDADLFRDHAGAGLL